MHKQTPSGKPAPHGIASASLVVAPLAQTPWPDAQPKLPTQPQASAPATPSTQLRSSEACTQRCAGGQLDCIQLGCGDPTTPSSSILSCTATLTRSPRSAAHDMMTSIQLVTQVRPDAPHFVLFLERLADNAALARKRRHCPLKRAWLHRGERQELCVEAVILQGKEPILRWHHLLAHTTHRRSDCRCQIRHVKASGLARIRALVFPGEKLAAAKNAERRENQVEVAAPHIEFAFAAPMTSSPALPLLPHALPSRSWCWKPSR